MKRLLVLFGVISFGFVACGLAVADVIGNPADIHLPPGKGVYSAQMGDFITLRAGFDTEFLIEKKFKTNNEGSTDPKLEGVSYNAKFGCTLFNRVQPYLTLGISDFEMSWKSAGQNVNVEFGNAPIWGAGLKAYLWEFQGMGLKIFSTASFRSTKPDKIRSLSVGGVTGNITEKKIEIFERQATVGLSREFLFPGFENVSIVPYIGGVWSNTDARVKITQGTNILNSGAREAKENLGLFFGADFIMMDNLSLNAEVRLIDQKSASLGFTTVF